MMTQTILWPPSSPSILVQARTASPRPLHIGRVFQMLSSITAKLPTEQPRIFLSCPLNKLLIHRATPHVDGTSATTISIMVWVQSRRRFDHTITIIALVEGYSSLVGQDTRDLDMEYSGPLVHTPSGFGVSTGGCSKYQRKQLLEVLLQDLFRRIDNNQPRILLLAV